jgi:hypothetical protein
MSTPTKSPKVRRKSVRFRDDSTMLGTLNNKIPVLVFSESSKGCGLIVLADFCPNEGSKVAVKIGTFGNLKGVVRWKKEPSVEVALIGIEYV